MTAADWQDPGAQSLTLYLDGTDAPDRAPDGGDLLDDDFLVLINACGQGPRRSNQRDECQIGLCRAVIHIGRCGAGSAGAVWSARSA